MQLKANFMRIILQNKHTINTAASDHVFKPKKQERERRKKSRMGFFYEEEFQRLLLLITGHFSLSGYRVSLQTPKRGGLFVRYSFNLHAYH